MPACGAPRFYKPELDVVRFFAFLLVFLSHGLPQSSASTFAGAAVHACAFGLPLFFCLSAYLITTLLLLERERTGTVALPAFYKRRALRIWPLYLSALAVSAAGSMLHGTFPSTAPWYLAALFMVANFVWWIRTTAAHLWSISIEEQFYLFWPALTRLLSTQALLGAVLLLTIASNAALAMFGVHHVRHDGRIWTNSLVQAQFFAGGIFLAIIHREGSPRAITLALRPLLMAAALSAWFAAVRVFHVLGDPLEPVAGAGSLCSGYALAMLGCIAVLLSLHGSHRWPAPLVYLGKISYGLYVFHAASLSASEHLLLRYGRFASLCGAFLLTVALAACSYRFLERPFLRLKERLEVVRSRPIGA